MSGADLFWREDPLPSSNSDSKCPAVRYDSPLRDVAYVAERLGISVQAVYDLVFHKRIAVVRLGSGRGGRAHAPLRFLDEDVAAFINSRREPATAAASPEEAGVGHPTTALPRRRAVRGVLNLPGADRFTGGARR